MLDEKKTRKAEDNLIYTPDGADISSFDFEFDGKNTSKFTLSPAGKRQIFSYGYHNSIIVDINIKFVYFFM